MKNLENLSLVELNTQEMKQTEGGINIGKFLKGVTWIGIATDLVEHWDEFEKGFSSGYAAASSK